MRKLTSLLLAAATLAAGSSLTAAEMTKAMDAPKVASTGGTSPHETTSVVLGDRGTPTRVGITYGRPYSKNPKTGEMRKIWGGLVPYGKADRMGSDEATILLTQTPLDIAGTTIPAGAYTLYIVPSESGPTKLAFSSNLGKWGIPVDETKDVARFDLKKDTLPQSMDQLTITITKDPVAQGTPATGGGTIKISWETTQFSLPIAIKK